MKKIIAIFLIAIFIILLSPNVSVFADSSHYMITYSHTVDQYGDLYTCKLWNAKATSTIVQNYDGTYSITNMNTNTGAAYNSTSRNSMAEAMAEIYQEASELPSDFTGRNYTINAQSNIILNNVSYSVNNPTEGDFFPSINDYEDSVNPPPEPLTWYEELFNDFVDYIGAGINGGVEGFINWLVEAWTIPVGEGEDDFNLDLITPTPSPTPIPTPTPIPYQTQLTPDGNGGFNITYIYVNPSGTPTSAPMPPNNPPSGSNPGDDNDFEYPYYNNPVNSDDPYELDIPWYLKFKFKGVTTSLNDFQAGIDETVDMVNDNQENIDIVMDSVGLFPNDWLLIFGFIGAIPLVGGIISRLLKG